MRDIVAELRKWADAPIKSAAISKTLREAADEIERLQKLIQQIYPYLDADIASTLRIGGPNPDDPEYKEDCPQCIQYKKSIQAAKLGPQ